VFLVGVVITDKNKTMKKKETKQKVEHLEPEENQEKLRQQYEDVVNTDEVKKEVSPSKEAVIDKLQNELVDLKDLYDNVVKENTGLTKERNELQAKVIELQAILADNNDNQKSEIAEYEDTLVDYRKDVAVLETTCDQQLMQIENLNLIIEMLINKE